ncbi:MAG: hypothetical protein KBT35_05705 [Firmicutes bacterium]|nr:hypothetical protein [Candidatus Colivicinus equi]
MADGSRKESARRIRLEKLRPVRAVRYKGGTFELTSSGYSIAKTLKDVIDVDTSNEPLDEIT